MNLRWSNGQDRAVEFAVARPEEMARGMCDGLIDYRRQCGNSRVELHVEVSPPSEHYPLGRWTDPAFPTHGYVHVVNCGEWVPPDGESVEPQVRGTDYVLIVGPGAWHAEQCYRAARHACGYYNRICAVGADVAEAIESMASE